MLVNRGIKYFKTFNSKTVVRKGNVEVFNINLNSIDIKVLCLLLVFCFLSLFLESKNVILILDKPCYGMLCINNDLHEDDANETKKKKT